MSKIRLAGVVVSLVFLIALNGQAQPALLVEMSLDSEPRFGGSLGGNPPPTSLLYVFAIAAPTGQTSIGGGWSHDVMISDIGQTFAVEATEVAGMSEALQRANPFFGIGITPQNTLEFSLNSLLHPPIPAGAGNTVEFAMHVPGLTGWRATEATVTIDDFSVRDTGMGSWQFAGALTARVYGEPVPEPLTLTTSFLCAVCLVHFRTRRLADNIALR
jgi:hypothetical protein